MKQRQGKKNEINRSLKKEFGKGKVRNKLLQRY